jgi:hypothetical protein
MVLVSVCCLSQNKQIYIIYGSASVPMTNPGADVSYKLFGVPLLSGISVNAGLFSAYDLFADNGVNYNTKLRDVVHRSSRNDKLAFNEQIELFSGGFKLEIGLKTKDMFRLECTRSLTL